MITMVAAQGESPLVEQASCPPGPVSLPSRTLPRLLLRQPSGHRPRAEPAAKDTPADDPCPGDDNRSGSGSGHQRPPDLTWSAAVADFNGDGWPDLFIGHHGHLANLWINNHDGTFHRD